MPSYSLPAKDPNQRLFRIAAFGIVFLLSIIFFIAAHDPDGLSDQARKTIGGIAFGAVFVSIVGAMVFSAKGGMWNLQRKFRFEITDDRLFQFREGFPAVEISLTEIASLLETGDWLIVDGGSPNSRITIPSRIEGFEELKQRLSAHCAPRPLQKRFPFLACILVALGLSAYTALFFSPRGWVIVASGCVAVALQGLGFYSLRSVYRKRQIPILVWAFYVFTCLATFWIMYRRAR